MRVCPQCNVANPAVFRFCGACGSSLKAAEAQPAPTAERRQLTVLFCDLVGSTQLSEKLDAEELRDLVREYQSVCTEVIRRYDGHVAQYLGDGILVYFGYPTAHEDDALRAVHAGLGLVAAVRGLQTRFGDGPRAALAVRVGMHTGEVVAGEVGAGASREHLALGHTPNVAARIEGAASPGAVLMSATTHALVRGRFEYRSLGPTALKGLSQPIELFEVLSATDLRSSFEVAESHGLTPIVGRETEMAVLLECFARADSGLLEPVHVSGEAGIGKSRVVHQFRERLAGQPHNWVTVRCSPYELQSSLAPVIGWIEELFELGSHHSLAEKFAALDAGARRFSVLAHEGVPLLARLLSLPVGSAYPPLESTPQRLKEQTLALLVRLITEIAGERPLVFVVEDLHWADPSTLELLSVLMAGTAPARILPCLTYRPEFEPPWAPRGRYVRLERLVERDAEALISSVTGGRPLPRDVAREILARTDGVPLFVEELTKMLLESGLLRLSDGAYELAGPLPPMAIPSTLQDSLAARLDRLGDARQVAQLAAVLGREFSYEMLSVVAGKSDVVLQQSLGKLVDAGLVFQRGTPPQAQFTFKHALIRDAAYSSLLRSTRQQHHAEIAQLLVKRFPDTAETRPELVAHHYTEAGLGGASVEYWLKAGQRAMERSANVEASAHLQKGIALIENEPASLGRDAQELALQTTLGSALVFSRGYGSPDVEQHFSRAYELCERMGEVPELVRAVVGLWMFYAVRADYKKAVELGHRIAAIGASLNSPMIAMQAHYCIGFPQFFLGDLTSMRREFELGLALNTPGLDRTVPYTPTHDDPVVHLRSFLGYVLWHLGFPEQALAQGNEAVREAQRFGNSYGLSFAVNALGWVRHYCRDPHGTAESARELLGIAQEKGYPYWLATGGALLGWALAEGDAGDEGVVYMQQSLAGYRRSGARMGQTRLLHNLIDAHIRRGQLDQARPLLQELGAAIDETHERTWESEFHRLSAELSLATAANGDPDARRAALTSARASLELGAAIARRQSARSLELRSALLLARVRLQLGDRHALNNLRELYDSFTEGHATLDLIEARQLLDGQESAAAGFAATQKKAAAPPARHREAK